MNSNQTALQVKKLKPAPRASHVNFGTAVPRDDLPWPKRAGPVVQMPRLHTETEQRASVTRFGGLVLAEQFLRRFGVARLIDEHVKVLKIHLPYHESDHVIAQALNLYVGGSCIEDMMHLQHDEAVLRMLGACRLPDPTTAGDFLRRFDTQLHPAALTGLRRANDELQEKVWRKLARRSKRRRKREWCVLDIDSHIKKLYGVQKEGADFSYDGRWSYQPQLVSMASTGECLGIRNRPGSANASGGAGELVGGILDRVKKHFDHTLVRGDSAFDSQPLREAIERRGGFFAFVGRAQRGRPEMAAALPDSAFRPFRTRAARERSERSTRHGYKPRRKKRNMKRKRARDRGYRELRLVKQWVAETTYQPPGQPKTYRLIVRRQLIENHKGQQHIFDEHRDRYVVTNLPASISAEEAVDMTYERCDQENVIEQMGSGLAAWRMPVAEFDGNSAWLEIARLAWNMAKWIAQLALPPEVVRWEWKRFRLHFVLVPAQVIKRSRQLWVRLMGARSTIDPLTIAFRGL
jgi:hypothetical protein